MLKSVDFDRSISSEGTKKLILTFTSKTGQSVDYTSTEYYYLDYSVRERIY